MSPPASVLAISDSATVVPANNLEIDGDDDCNSSTIPLGFDFDYFGQTYDEVYISTNGTLSFTEVLNTEYVEGESNPDDQFLCFEGYDNDFSFLDRTGETEDLNENTIYAFWDDLNSEFANIYYQTLGAPGSQQFVVQWTNSYSNFQSTDDEAYANYGPPLGTIQLILDEATGKITMQYLDMKLGNYGEGMSATVGLTGNFDDSEYVVYSHLEEIIDTNPIEFTPSGNSFTVSDEGDLLDIYLDDGNLPDTGINLWYEFDNSLADSTNNNTDLVLTGDAIDYGTDGLLNLPIAASTGTQTTLTNESLTMPTGDFQISVAINPLDLPSLGSVAEILYLGAGLEDQRVSLNLLDNGKILLDTNLGGLGGAEEQPAVSNDSVNLEQLNLVTAYFDSAENQWSLYLNDVFQASTITYEINADFDDITAMRLSLGTDVIDPNIESFNGNIGALAIWNNFPDISDRPDSEYLTTIYNEGNIRPYDYMFETNSTTTTPTLNWHDFNGNDTYELIVSTSPNFEAGTEDESDYERLNNTIVFQEDDIEALSYTFDPENTPFREGQTYYWMIMAVNGYTEGDPALQTSRVSSFTIPYTYEFTGDGAGTEGDPYLISDCAELLEVNELLFGNNYFELITDLDCSLVGNDIIIGSEFSGFEGVFDGAGNTVTVALMGDSHVGLFAKLYQAEVKNLTVEGSIAGTMVGSIVGLAVESTLQNVTATANTFVNGVGIEPNFDENIEEVEDNAGGLVGYLYRSDLRDSFSNAVVTGDWENIGGAVGHAVRSEIGNSGSDSVVNGNTDTGGFAGDIDISIVYDSYSDGIVTGVEYIGGFVGDTDTFANYERVYSNASVTSTQGSSGGLIGTADDYVILNKVYATGDVTGQSPAVPDENDEVDGIDNFYTGGLIGQIDNGVEITDAYALGNVSGDVVGGLIGQIDNDDTPSVVTNAYSKGLVTSNGNYGLGGLVAILDDENSVISSHWNTQTSGTTISAAGEGITITQMQDQSTFENWDFETIWTIDNNNILNSGYPYFGWQENITEFTDIPPATPTSNGGGGGSGSKKASSPQESNYEKELQTVLAQKIVTQNPDSFTNKCEALIMMSRVFDWQVPTASTSKYTDVPTWCVSIAAFGTDRGIVEGRDATRLGMESPVTRDEVAVMIHRELKLQNYKFGDFSNVKFAGFADQLTPWASDSILTLYKEGIIKGFPNPDSNSAQTIFDGNRNILKQDLAIMLVRSTGIKTPSNSTNTMRSSSTTKNAEVDKEDKNSKVKSNN
jgi:hypothetical protein